MSHLHEPKIISKEVIQAINIVVLQVIMEINLG
jgi:hypothetical protein